MGESRRRVPERCGRGGRLTKDRCAQHTGPCGHAVLSSVNFAFFGKKKVLWIHFFMKLIVLPQAAGKMRLGELQGTEAGSGQHPGACPALHGSACPGRAVWREAADEAPSPLPGRGGARARGLSAQTGSVTVSAASSAVSLSDLSSCGGHENRALPSQ